MKKLLLSITVFIFSLFIYLPNTYAINYYEQVNIKTVFEDTINTDEIEWIDIFLEDSTEYSKEYILEKAKNFELIVEKVPIGPYKFSYGVVNNDEIGYYKVSGEVNIDEVAKIVNVTIIVTLQNNKKHNDGRIDEETKQEIIGSSSTNNKTTTKKVDTFEETDEDNDDDDENIDIIIGEENQEEKETSEEKETNQSEKEKEQEERELEKEKNRKKNSLIAKILFSCLGIVVLVVGIFAAIKISVANK